MESRILLQPAYIIHRQAFQNSSLLIDFFCMDYGRVRAVAKGARRNKSPLRALTQLFQPLLASFSGKGEVKTVTGLEGTVAAIRLEGERLFSGMYINELLSRLLVGHEEHRKLYQSYQEALLALQGNAELTTVLRQFELALLRELGYGLNLEEDVSDGSQIKDGNYYSLVPDQGFRQALSASATDNLFRGEHISALARLDFTDTECLRTAKMITRLALSYHLGDKPLMSRSLFNQRSPSD